MQQQQHQYCGMHVYHRLLVCHSIPSCCIGSVCTAVFRAACPCFLYLRRKKRLSSRTSREGSDKPRELGQKAVLFFFFETHTSSGSTSPVQPTPSFLVLEKPKRRVFLCRMSPFPFHLPWAPRPIVCAPFILSRTYRPARCLLRVSVPLF